MNKNTAYKAIITKKDNMDGSIKRNEKLYFACDTFEISDEVKNMSHEERQRRILILEEAARKEAENISDTKPLLAI